MDQTDYLSFIQKIGLLGGSEINCIETSKLLYEAFLTKFQISLANDTDEIFFTYQNLVYDLVEQMHTMDLSEIKSIFKILDEENPCLADIVIMSWSLPRVGQYHSQIAYDNCYRNQIKKYNHILMDIVDFYVIENFCIETLTKTNNVPVHCIDILWYYMNNINLDVSFNGDSNKRYIGIKIDEDDTDYIFLEIHMTYLLELNLGQTICKSDPNPKKPFRSFLRKMITEPDLVSALKTSSTGKNFIKQYNHINDNFKKYFADDIL